MSRRGRAVYNRKKLVAAALVLLVLSGCGTEALPETVEVEEISAPEPEKEAEPEKTKKSKKEKKEQPEANPFGLTDKELKEMENVLSLGPYSYTLEDVAEITRRGEDELFVNYKVILHSGETLLPSINKNLLD